MSKHSVRFAALAPIALLGACADDRDAPANLDEFYAELAQTFAAKPPHTSRAYAIMKDGLAGPDWLATIHGYPDNSGVCEELIAPYNSDPSQSTLPGRYFCKEL